MKENNLTPNIPLLCWDIANPQLVKNQQLAMDMQSFARLKANHDWQFETDLRPLLVENRTVVVTEQTSRIIWVSSGFSNLTGYQPVEMMGKSPALLQGPRTSLRTKMLVRQKLAHFEAVTITIQNYRKEGTPYWCQIDIHPLFNTQAECTHFVAFEKELANLSRQSVSD